MSDEEELQRLIDAELLSGLRFGSRGLGPTGGREGRPGRSERKTYGILTGSPAGSSGTP